jgi:hypothetical protein
MMKHSQHTWDVPMPIKLDWRFTLLDNIGKVRMKELRDFARQAEDHFEDAMKTWNEKSTGLSEEEEAMMGDYFIERKDNIESLLDRGYTLGILGLYSFLERFLNEVVDHLRTGGAPIPPSNKGFNLHKLRTHLGSVGIDMSTAPFNWNELDKFREVRNCIAHTNGWITQDLAVRLRRLGMRVEADSELKLPENYFQHSWALVDDTYLLVFKKAWEQFGYGKQKAV